MINFNNIFDYIVDFTQKNSSSIIYIGVGSEHNDYNIKKWEFHENQQFPPFLNDAKIKFMNTKILIILIDPLISEIPFIITTSDSFLENSWKKSDVHENLFESEMGVEVITIKEYVSWGTYLQWNSQSFNIQDIMLDLTKYISQPNINSLLFYQEFTGKNTILLEYLIKSNYDYNDSKICIDITRGADLSCYFNLSNPEYYPIITLDNSKLIYRNPKIIKNDELNLIINQYKKFKFNSENCPFTQNKLNYLIDKPDNLILFFQIIKIDLISLELFKGSIISMIRQFFTMGTKSNYGSQMWAVRTFSTLKSRFKFITSNIELIESNLILIDKLNEEKDSNEEYEDLFEHIKQQILEELLKILEVILKNIVIKYNVSEYDVDQLIAIIYTLPDKYKLLEVFDSFITKNIC